MLGKESSSGNSSDGLKTKSFEATCGILAIKTTPLDGHRSITNWHFNLHGLPLETCYDFAEQCIEILGTFGYITLVPVHRLCIVLNEEYVAFEL